MKKQIHPNYHTSYLSKIKLSERLLALLWINISLVIALFLADGGLIRVSTPAEIWIGIGQITGLIGTNLLMVQLILASRLPWIDKSFGHDRAMLLHKQLGKPILYLILGHVIAITTGYGLTGKLSFIGSIISMLNFPDILFAVIGTIFLLLIVITSLVIVRKRLDYDLWFILHLLAYIAVIAAIPHQFSIGAIFAVGTVARYYWIALYLFAGLSILIFRFIKPVVLSLRHSLYISDVVIEDEDVITLHIKGRVLESLEVSAGQFFMWRFWSKGLWWQAHPFSLSASPKKGVLRVTVRSLGNGSQKIQSLKVGTKVSIEGPYGLFTERSRTSERVVLIAAGIGITPIRSLLEDATFKYGKATLIIRNSFGKKIYLYDEILKLAEKRGVTVYVVQGTQPKHLQSWLPHEYITKNINLNNMAEDLLNSDIYICGPTNWTNLVVKDAKKLGVPNHQIHWERFNW